MKRRANSPTCAAVAPIPVTLLLLLGAPGDSCGQVSDVPTWSITPYLWATTTELDLSFRDRDVGQGQLTFGDLLDRLDAAFMIHAEGGRGQWSVFGDLTYLEISDTNQRQMVTIDSSSEQVFFDAAVAYWPGERGTGLSLYGGLRYTSFDDRFRFSADGTPLDELRADNAYYDLLLGARYYFSLGNRWSLLTSGDISFGDSEGTYLLRGAFAYSVGKRRQNQILLGYQYKQAEFMAGELNTDFTYYGPTAGFSFKF